MFGASQVLLAVKFCARANGAQMDIARSQNMVARTVLTGLWGEE